MATMHGLPLLCWLTERGWKEAPVPDEEVCGDQGVIDGVTGEEVTVYEAARRHWDRTGEYPAFLDG